MKMAHAYCQPRSKVAGLFFAALALSCVAAAQTVTKVMTIPTYPKHSIQGMVITADGYLVQCHDQGYCRIYDFKAKNPEPLADFRLGSSGTGNHANAASLSSTYYKGNKDFPLLYVTGGVASGPMVCHVENIVKDGSSYSARQVQAITLADEFRWDMAPASHYKTDDGFYKIWGFPSWLVDNEEKCLYVFSAIYRTTLPYARHKEQNRYVATKMRLPDVSEGDVVLTRADVLDQILYDFDVFITQSGCIKDSKIFYTFGFGKPRESLKSSQMRVFDIKQRKIVQSLDLAEAIPEELEACSFYKGDLYVMTVKGNVYKIGL